MSIRDVCEKLWKGEVDFASWHPVSTPYLEAEELEDGVLYYKGLAGATTIDTGDGLVMLDTGGELDTARLHQQVRRWRADTHLAAAIFSHHHVDHIFGVGPFEQEAVDKGWGWPLVYGHAAISSHLDRYKKTPGWNTAINVRQFAVPPSAGFRWPSEFRYPDVEYQERLRFARGDLSFELRHTRGETEDATWTWIPEKRILAPGDLFIWAVPNAGNPQGPALVRRVGCRAARDGRSARRRWCRATGCPSSAPSVSRLRSAILPSCWSRLRARRWP